jgi:hypothetical protein
MGLAELRENRSFRPGLLPGIKSENAMGQSNILSLVELYNANLKPRSRHCFQCTQNCDFDENVWYPQKLPMDSEIRS